jgi:hypothetical protein
MADRKACQLVERGKAEADLHAARLDRVEQRRLVAEPGVGQHPRNGVISGRDGRRFIERQGGELHHFHGSGRRSGIETSG